MLDILKVVIVHANNFRTRDLELLFPLGRWYNFTSLASVHGDCTPLYFMLCLPIHLGFLNLSVIYPVDGGPPHWALVGENELWGDATSHVGCVCDADEGVWLLMRWIHMWDERLLSDGLTLSTQGYSSGNSHWWHGFSIIGHNGWVLRSLRTDDVGESRLFLVLSTWHIRWHHFTNCIQTLC